MNPWLEIKVPILEGESEDELIAHFVKLTCIYDKHSPATVCEFVFQNRREPGRWLQAAQVWPKNLDILERIRLAKLNGGREPEDVDSIEAKLLKLQAMYDDDSQPMKERINAMRLHSELKKEITKSVEKDVKKTETRVLPQIIFKRYEDDNAAAG